MNKILIPALLGLLTATIGASAAGNTAQSIKQFADINRYVGREAQPSSPRQLTYTSDGEHYLELTDGGTKIVKYSIKTGQEVETILDLTHTRTTTLKSVSGYRMSPDGSKILLTTDSRPVYRRSSTAVYYVYEIRTRILKPLSEKQPRQQAPLFSPDGRMIAFVADNNIFLAKLDYGTEVQVTTDGLKDHILNGIPDWTYEEEFTTASSMTWAPDNLTLCYIRYDESAVPLYTFPLYEGTCPSLAQYSLYPGSFTYKYPVPGEPNSRVEVRSYDIETRKTKTIELPSGYEYIPRITYAGTAERLVVTTLNRDQTRMELFVANPKSTVARSILVEQADAWLPEAAYEATYFGDNFFVITSSRSGYSHLYQYNYNGVMLRQLTSGAFDVTAYYGYDATRDIHFYQSAEPSPLQRVVSQVDKKDRITRLSPETGWASATFGPGMKYFTLRHTTAAQPPVYTLCNSTGKTVRVLEDNASYARKWAGAPTKEFFTFVSDGNTLNGYIIKPVPFDPSKRYPVVMYQYSGPGSQEVTDQWSMGWAQYFATQGYVIACVDGRGTGGRGRDFMVSVYKNLGHFESIDQVAAARHIATLPYVDASRIGIFGWSYGGYEALMAASFEGAPYAAAVAVAPVTDWRYYDTVYAERYMLTPGQNEDGYRASAPINHIESLVCPVLLMSGTADDNVHFSNTVEYAGRAQGSGRWIDMLIFPNKNHSINGCDNRAIVYGRMLDYFNHQMK